MAQHREASFAGEGGLAIYWQAWLPDGDPRASVVIAHGAAEYGARYRHVADALAGRGYGVWALDHRGHGHSEGRRAYLDRLENGVEDIRTLVGRASAWAGGKPFLLGHSMGGALSIAYAIRYQDDLSGLLLSAPVATVEAASTPMRAASLALSAVWPGLGIYQVDAAAISRDPEVVSGYEADPLIHHEKLPVRTVAELANEVGAFPERAAGISLPVLIMHGTGDRIAPPAGSEMLADRVSSEDVTLKLYDGLYHEILNEPEQDRVIADVIGWLDERA